MPARTCWRPTVSPRDQRSEATLAETDGIEQIDHIDGVDEAARWAVEAARAADAKQGQDTVVLTVGAVLAITEHFVITHGRNSRQVRTIVDDVERQISEAGGPKPRRIEGLEDLSWVLLDYGDFVVHVFSEEARAFYELERLWSDVPRVDWSAA